MLTVEKTFCLRGSRLFLIGLMALSLSCDKKSAPAREIVDFSQHYSIEHRLLENASLLLVEIRLGEGLHAYAAGESIGKPIRLELFPQSAGLGPALIPEGKVKRLQGLGESRVLEKDILIKQRLNPGPGPLEAVLYLQVCTDKACDRPREHRLSIK